MVSCKDYTRILDFSKIFAATKTFAVRFSSYRLRYGDKEKNTFFEIISPSGVDILITILANEHFHRIFQHYFIYESQFFDNYPNI